MLVQFHVGNFLSFKQPVTLSMVAAKINARDRQVDENNTIPVDDDLALLTSGAIYGANASGKSNLVKAMHFMRSLVLSSSKESQVDELIPVSPFRLSTETDNQPSFFEVIFLLDKVVYRYGFEVDRREVATEWLFASFSQRETRLFLRQAGEFKTGRRFREGHNLEARTRSNALFLSVVAQFNGPIAGRILGWFRDLRLISGLEDQAYSRFTLENFENGNYRQEIIELVKKLDLGIEDIHTQRGKIDKSKAYFPESLPRAIRDEPLMPISAEGPSIRTTHTKFDSDGRPIATEFFDLNEDESAGTEKLFFLAGPVLDALANGRVLWIDEMDARLHPLMTRTLIGLFNSRQTNPRRAQLVFTTHDTNLLSNKLFRRDQIWFIEKDRYGAGHLYSLAEIKVRNDASFENDYIQGRYGAVPFLGDIRTVIVDHEA
jgi:uncharacterized protein